MPTALVIRCKLCISQPNASQHQYFSLMVHCKTNILHLHEVTLSPIEFPSPSFVGLLLFVFLQVYAWLLHQYL